MPTNNLWTGAHMRRLILAAMVVVNGCTPEAGPQTMRVWGDVTYDGKPVQKGTVDFLSTDGSAPAQAQIEAGHYDLPAPSGPVAEKTYRVEISAMAKTGKSLVNVMGDGEPTMEPLYNTIPPRYNTQSTLTATISPDASKNQFDFKLEKAEGVRKPR
jgi:hypothetical protein